MTIDLFDTDDVLPLAEGALRLRGLALPYEHALAVDLQRVFDEAPPRHLVTPGGLRMSVAMTNCGALGWVSDRTGYRYDPLDPERRRPWPVLPASFLQLAREAAVRAGYPGFSPDACLVNRYVPGARLSLHQDRDERSLDHPIVSVSLSRPAARPTR